MKRAALVLATVATFGATTIAATAPAEARGGFGPGLAGGLMPVPLSVALRRTPTGTARAMATMEVMHRHTMTITPPVTTADTHLRTTVDMPRHITVTGIEGYTVRPMPTRAAPVIMEAGIVVGVTAGKTNTGKAAA